MATVLALTFVMWFVIIVGRSGWHPSWRPEPSANAGSPVFESIRNLDKARAELKTAEVNMKLLLEKVRSLESELEETRADDGQIAPGAGTVSDLNTGTCPDTIKLQEELFRVKERERVLREHNCGYGPAPRITAYLLVGQMTEEMEQNYTLASRDMEEWPLPGDDQYEERVGEWIDEFRKENSITVGYIQEDKITPWVAAHFAAFTKNVFSLVFPERHVRAIPIKKEGFPMHEVVEETTKLLSNGYPHIILGTGWFVDKSLKKTAPFIQGKLPEPGRWVNLTNYQTSTIKKAENRPIIVSFDHEPWAGNCEHEDIIINCKMDPPDSGCINVFQPHAPQWWFQRERRFPLEQKSSSSSSSSS
eukprot:CAMPEP_0167793738 /NCGR_PEP_ID=MMETSP0111_2-20121227/13369_1 /TAXON_ID=91324 /ORGANISM="Lotharella globosa, Strain CCCM811" /LENGTH=360 /DNA_ID=CAMNT_0007686973 /DNA_START=52 /DNA_END=1132 /DNA_ORIENTATION=-